MKQNMGFLDRTVRTLLAVSIIGLAYLGIVAGTLATILLGVAALFLLTSIFAYCPLYSLLHINTGRRSSSSIKNANN